jgi:hypothetical protein
MQLPVPRAEPTPFSLDALPDDSSVDEPLRAPFRAHRERRARAMADEAVLDRQGARLANLRTVAFVGAAALLVGTYFAGWPPALYGAAAALAAAYVALAAVHHRVILREEAARIRRRVSERGIGRLTGQWQRFPSRGERFASETHLYAPDLDVFGQASLFQLLDETATRHGEEVLAGWLSKAAGAEEVEARQGAVRELAGLLDFREALAVEGARLSSAKADPGRFIEWCEGGPYLESIRWARWIPAVLPPLSLTVFILSRVGVIPDWAGWPLLVAQLFVLLGTRGPLADLFNRISAGERSVIRYDAMVAMVEAQAFQHPRLLALQRGLQGGTEKVSTHLARFARAYSFAELRLNGQVHAFVNFFTLWDLIWMFRLEAWRRAHGAQVRGWFAALAELEALCSLAAYAYARPTHVFPKVGGDLRYVARGLGHPLLDRPVVNDVSLPSARAALLVTGSNMSGKTTLLRAMGANAVLALAGAPVCAAELELSELQVLTSMRVKDSLERGVSYFYAEVSRLRVLLDAATERHGKVLFLLDEILLGTNTVERQLASREVLALFLRTGAAGAVSTHDLSLASLEGSPEFKVRNVHFRDLLTDGQMTFDYRLREGVVDTTNALRVLRQAGIPVSG